MKCFPLPSKERLHSLLDYDQETGIFRWKAAPRRGRSRVGEIAGSINVWGYRVIGIDGHQYQAARVAWKWVTGEEPVALMDHANMDTLDTRFSNLRQATHTQNMQNRRNRKGRSLPKGVWEAGDKYSAFICVNGTRMYLGVYFTPEGAGRAYKKAANRYFGEYARAV